MPIKDIVKITISALAGGVTQAGFGVPLILSHSATWTERTRTYTGVDGVEADFAVTTPEYLAAQKMFSQIPSPDSLVIGRSAVKPTQSFTISVLTVANNAHYALRIGAVTFDYVSDGTATNDEIVIGLATLITTSGLTITNPGVSGSKTVHLAAITPGAWFDVEVINTSLLSVAQDHADPGITADFSAIKNENDTWYTLCTLFNSKAYIMAAAAWIESNEKLYLAASIDTEIINTADVSATDVAHTLKASAYARTAIVYHPSVGAFIDAAFMGACLPLDSGSETWKFKTLATVPVVVFTATQITNVKAKNCNYYYAVAGQNMTAEGTVAVGEYIDVIRFRDWFKARLGERIFGKLKNAKKIPMTNPGIAVIENEVRGQIADGIAVGGLTDTPVSTVIVPKASAISDADKAARKLSGVKFKTYLAGAIHAVEVDGEIVN